jgi:hypothetical protein
MAGRKRCSRRIGVAVVCDRNPATGAVRVTPQRKA